VSHLIDAAAAGAALIASWLPRRYWSTLHVLPIPRAAALSAILTVIASAVIGLGGFLEQGERVQRELGAMIVRVAEGQLKGDVPEDARFNAAPAAIAMLTPLEFALFTPIGLFSTYLALSGLARGVGCATGEPFGDPLLTAIDSGVCRLIGSTREGHQRRTRLRREGVEVPDRLYTAGWAGLTDADFVVVASRRKPEWDAGTFVITSDKWYTLGAPFELDLPDGLRTIYPLKEQTQNEVMRRSVSYELPPLRHGPPRARRG
jgi:hypothetical protein